MTPALPDPRNADILVYVGGELLPREQAKVSVFDSSVQGGDAVWEGLRVYKGRIFQLDAHLERLVDSAKAMAFADIPDRSTIKQAVFDTLRANAMRDGVHIRLTLTRGKKVTSGMDPRLNQYGANADRAGGVEAARLQSGRHSPGHGVGAPQYAPVHRLQDSPQQPHQQHPRQNRSQRGRRRRCIMLDIHGFVSETNATNIFIAKRGALLTPHADSCLPGITRRVVIELALRSGHSVWWSATFRCRKYTARTRYLRPAPWASWRPSLRWMDASSVQARPAR